MLDITMSISNSNNNHREQTKRPVFSLSGTGGGAAGASAIIIIALALLAGGFALISPITATPTPSNSTTTATTNVPIQLVTPSAAAQQIINNTKGECEQAQFLQKRCVVLVYESPKTVVLSGLVKIFGGSPESRGLYPNPFLWNAVDGFKAQGYTITAIAMNVVGGNKSSDNEFHVIMSK
jgi:hypothetical protein